MANSNLVEVTWETADTVIEIRGKSRRPDKARIQNFFKNFFDDSEVSDGSFRKEWKQLRTKKLL